MTIQKSKWILLLIVFMNIIPTNAEMSYLMLNSIRIGDLKSSVFKKYGQPMHNVKHPDGVESLCFWLSDKHDSYLCIDIFPADTTRIWALQISAKPGVRVDGFDDIYLSMPVESLYTLFGKPTSVTELQDVQGKNLAYDNGNCSFEIQDGIVKSIRLICPVPDIAMLDEGKDQIHAIFNKDSSYSSEPGNLLQRIKKDALRLGKEFGISRYALFDNVLPADVDDYNKLDKNSVLFLVLLSKERKELPVQKVYVKTETGEYDLTIVHSAIEEVSDADIKKAFGTYQQIAVCLLPLKIQNKQLKLFVDWGANRKAFSIGDIPSSAQTIFPLFTADPDWQSQSGKVDKKFLKAFVKRELHIRL